MLSEAPIRVLAGFLPHVLFRLQMVEGIKATGVANTLVRIRALPRPAPADGGFAQGRGGQPEEVTRFCRGSALEKKCAV